MNPRLNHSWRAVLAALVLTGCQSTSDKIGQRAIPAHEYTAAQAAAPQPVPGAALSYQLQPGDQIDIKFYYHPELNEQIVIGPDNLVALQLIGELSTENLSTQQLSDELTRRYAKTLKNSQATVILRKFASPRVFVAGEVAQPTAHALEGGRLTAFQAIIQSGGFRKSAERGNVVVLRSSGSGKPEFIKLDLQGHLEQAVDADLLLKPYDIVYVPQKRISEVADFFDEYFNKIVPIYRNLGFSFTYNLRNQVQVQSAP
jgi:protein involved in polysaccharide export with SLBB domain